MTTLKRKKCIALALVLLSFFLLLTGCSKQGQVSKESKASAETTESTEPLSRTELWLDTPCKITIYDHATEKNLDAAFSVLKDVHNKMNVNDENSEVSKINEAAGESYVKVSDETFYVLQEAVKYCTLTQGKFDVTVGPLVKLWGINTDHARVPSEAEIKERLPLVNYKNILLNEKEKSVMLKEKGMALDLGGIAKGYAGSAVAKALTKKGVQHAIINLGGNVVALGSKTDSTDWRVGIQNPLSDRGDYLGIVQVTNKAVVTSGIYERYFEQDGKRYHHIFDTSTGYPMDNNLASVTIVTDDSTNGDALAKVFCMGVEKGIPFIENLKGVEAIFVTKDNKVYTTSGLKDNFKITDTSFQLMN